MQELTSISGYVTVNRAAEMLGLTPHQVRALLRSGEVAGIRVSERGYMADAASVHTYGQRSQRKGRPMNQASALGALWELSGKQAAWLDYYQARRAKKALKGADAEKLALQCRRRAETKRYRVAASFLDDAKRLVSLSGVSAVAEHAIDLTGAENIVEGYIRRAYLPSFEDATFAVADQAGNAILHVVDDWFEIDCNEAMPVAVVAVDLTESLDTRTRWAGFDRLKELVDEYDIES